MSNQEMKTVMKRRAIQWDKFLELTIKEIQNTGCEIKIKKVEIERLIMRHRKIREIQHDIIQGFFGLKKVNEKVMEWMKG